MRSSMDDTREHGTKLETELAALKKECESLKLQMVHLYVFCARFFTGYLMTGRQHSRGATNTCTV